MAHKDGLVPCLIDIVADYSRHGALIQSAWKAMVVEYNAQVESVGFDFIQVLLWSQAQELLGLAGGGERAAILAFADTEEPKTLTGMLRDNDIHLISALILGFTINLKFTSSFGDVPYNRVTGAIREALES